MTKFQEDFLDQKNKIKINIEIVIFKVIPKLSGGTVNNNKFKIQKIIWSFLVFWFLLVVICKSTLYQFAM